MTTLRAPTLALTALGLLVLAACTARPSPTPSATATPVVAATAAADPAGAALYARYCAACHGTDGVAIASPWTPNLNSQGLLTVADDRFLYDSIWLGRPGANEAGHPGTKMPVFKEILQPEETAALVAFLRRWQTEPSVALPNSPLAGDAAAGAPMYAGKCSSCHGADGWGAEAPRLAGATFQATANDAFIAHTIRHGRPGTRMEAFALSDAELANLVAFIRTLGDGSAAP